MVERLRDEEEAAGPERRAGWRAWFGGGADSDELQLVRRRAWVDAEEEELRRWEDKVERDALKERIQNRGKPIWCFPQSHRLLSVLID